VALGLRDGETDIDDGPCYAQHLTEAYQLGLVDMSVIRRALANTFRIRFRLGLFDNSDTESGFVGGPPPQWLKFNMSTINSPEARQLNLEASRQSLILLQNRNKTLPFSVPAASDKVVIVGPSANSTRLLGGGHYARKLSVVDGFETGGFPAIPAAIEAVLRSLDSKASTEWHPGISCTANAQSVCLDPSADSQLLGQAMQAASTAGQVVLVLNLQSLGTCTSAKAYAAGGGTFNPCGAESESFDRLSLQLPKLQRELALAVLAATKLAGVPTAVVLIHGVDCFRYPPSRVIALDSPWAFWMI
jgi:hypothetical protein